MSQEFLITISARNNASGAFRALAADARSLASTLRSVAASSGGSGLSALSADATRAQAALRGVGAEAQRAGSSLQRIGQTRLSYLGADAQKANAELRNVGQSAQQAERGFTGLRASGVEVGAAMGVVVAGLSLVGRSAQEQRRQITGLRAAYGEAADGLDEFADAVQDATRFSDDAARESALIAQSLVSNYELTTSQLETLIERSADLAQVYGTDLVDAVQRTSGAIRGEGEAAERLGLNLSDAAVAARALDAGITNWNVPGALTEAEKASFRFSLFLEDTNYALGEAAAFGETAAGGFARFVNTVQDGGQALGSFIGPAAEAAAGLAPIALYLPVVSGGLGRIAPAALAGARGLLALSAAAGPVGLVLGTVAGAVAYGIGQFQRNNAAVEEATRQYRDLSEALNEVGDAQQQASLRGSLLDLETAVGTSERWGDSVNELDAAYEALIATREAGARATGNEVAATDAARGVWQEYALTLAEAASVNRDTVEGALAAGDDLDRYAGIVEDLNAAHRNGSLEGGVFQDVMHTLAEAYEFNGAGADRVRQAAHGLVEGFLSGRISAEQLDRGIVHLNDNMATLGPQWAQMGQAVQRFTADQLAAQTALGVSGQAARLTAQAVAQQRAEYEATLPVTDRFSQLRRDAALAAFDEAMATSDAGTATERYAEATEAANAVMEDFDQRAAQMADSLSGTLVPGLAGAEGAFAAMVPPGNDMLDVLAAMEGSVEPISRLHDATSGWNGAFQQLRQQAGESVQTFTQVADALNDTAQAADSVITTIIGTTEALGGRAETLDQYQQSLFNVADGTGRATDALNAGTISWDQYNEQVGLSTASAETNWRAQDALTRIMLQQAPYVQESADAYADQLEVLAQLPAVEQRRALALQDSAVQAKLAAVESARYGAALGEIDQQVATDIIVNSAQADPVLKDLLTEYGVIEEGAEGEIRVNFPDGESTQQSMQGIEEAVNRLNNTIIEIAIQSADTEEERKRLEDLKVAAEDADGQTVGIDAEVEGAEEGLAQLTDLRVGAGEADGQTVTIRGDATGMDTARREIELVGSTAAEVDGASAAVTVEAEGGPAVLSTFESVGGAAAEVDGTTATATVRAEGADQLRADLEAVGAEVSYLDGQSVTTQVTAEGASRARHDLSTVTATVQTLDGRQAIVQIEARGAETAAEAAQRTADELSRLTGSRYVVEVSAAGVPRIVEDLGQARAAVQEIDGAAASVTVSAQDQATPVIGQAAAGVAAFGGTSAAASLTATDGASPVVQAAVAVAQTFVQTYTGNLAATDGASGIIASVKGAADAFIQTYTASLSASDGASGTIAGAQGAATAFASSYPAALEAVDNASGVIAAVSGALAALDGQTATTYINTVTAGAPGGTGPSPYALGGRVGWLDGVPAARDGRVVKVGEVGEELVTLPVGSMVHHAGASRTRAGAKERAGRLGPGVGAAGSADEIRSSFTEVLRGGEAEAAAAGEALGRAAEEGLRRAARPDTSLKLGREWAESYWLGALEEGAATAEGAAWLARRATRAADDEVARALARLRGSQAQLRAAREEVERTSRAFDDAPSRAAMRDDVAARRAASRVGEKVDERRVASVGARADDLRGQIADARKDVRGAGGDEERRAAEAALAALRKRLDLTGDLAAALREAGRAGTAAEAEIAGFRVDSIRAKLDELKGRAREIGDFWGEQIAKANEQAARSTDRGGRKMERDLDKVGEAGVAAGEDLGSGIEAGVGTAEQAIQEFGASMEEAIADAAETGTEQIEAVQGSAEGLAEEAPTVKIGADRSLFDRIRDDVLSKVNGLDAAEAEVGIDGDDGPLTTAVDNLDGDTLGTVYMEVDYRDQNNDKPKKEGKRDGGRVGRGYAAGGQVLDPGWVPAAGGRVVRVGEAGEELVTLPYGAMVHPHGASAAMEQAARRGGRAAPPPAAGGGPAAVYHIQTLVVQAQTPDLAREIERSLVGR